MVGLSQLEEFVQKCSYFFQTVYAYHPIDGINRQKKLFCSRRFVWKDVGPFGHIDDVKGYVCNLIYQYSFKKFSSANIFLLHI